MGGIFGVSRRDGAPVTLAELTVLRKAMAHWGASGGVWLEGCAGLGQALMPRPGRGPEEVRPLVDAVTGLVLAATARIDNAPELLQQLGTRAAPGMSDAEVLLLAYRKWGEDCVSRIYGDWAFAAWHPAERRLFVARDHFGYVGLYYHADPRLIAFASDRNALLALGLTAITLDDLYIAQVLVSWPAYHGERTVHRPIRRLPPAHTLSVTPDSLDVRQYWFLEHVPEVRLTRRDDYVEAFRDVFDEAVRARLRSPGSPIDAGPRGDVGSTLSGGLDSSSTTVTAAALVAAEGQRLTALTSVPLWDTKPYVRDRFGDEWPYAQAVARMAGNVDLVAVDGTSVTPIAAVRRTLSIHNEPCHATANGYWMIELNQTARERGCRSVLTGQVGNAGISWTGSVYSQPLGYQLRQLGPWRWVWQRARDVAPLALWQLKARACTPDDWFRGSAIHPDLVRRLDLKRLRLDDPGIRPARNAMEGRRFLQPGRSFIGALHAQMGAAAGVEVRDPSADARVLSFVFGVPDRIFMDPDTGQDRWLIRAAMDGRLPDEVRLNRRRGRQAGDIVPRLRASAAEVETALDEVERGPGAAYVDVAHMRRSWQMVQREDTAEAYRQAGALLTRGLMAGLFVNAFCCGTR